MTAADDVRSIQRDIALRDEIRLMRAENELQTAAILTMVLAFNTDASRDEITESVTEVVVNARKRAAEQVLGAPLSE
jgi:hypothetical protein